MTKIYKRIVVPLGITVFLFFVYYFNAYEKRIYQSSLQFIDSLAHGTSNTNTNPSQASDAAASAAKLAAEQKKAEEEEKEKELDPCTVESPTRGFIDLRELSAFVTSEGETKAQPWQARGYGSKRNYTVGVCSSPFRSLTEGKVSADVNRTDIGAYYVNPDTNEYVSIGNFSTTPKFRGRKLALTYEGGDYCGDLVDNATGERLRKSTLMTFVCDREMLAKASVTFVGAFNDCNYVFEIRSHHVCPTALQGNDFAAVWIFFLIVLAALAVYFSGGFLYKKMKVRQPKV